MRTIAGKLGLSALLMVVAPFMLKAKIIQAGDTITTKSGWKLYVKEERSKKLQFIAQVWLLSNECGTGDAFRLGLGAEGDYFLPKFASVHGTYIKSYWGVQMMNASSDNKSDNDLSTFSLFEVGGRFHLIDRQRRAKHKVVLSSSTSYSMGYTTTTERYFKAKLPTKRILAIRGGLYGTAMPTSTNMNKTDVTGDKGSVATKDGTVFSNTYYTTSHTTGIYLGLSDILNMSIRYSIPDYGSYFSSFFRETYADIIFASTTFDPFISSGKTYAIEADVTGSFKTSKIGWRLGKKVCFTRRLCNMGFSFEIGNRPGVSGRGLYFGSGWSLAFAR